ncbi:MAG: O-methyltransferase [Sporolactobacillus sp.]
MTDFKELSAYASAFSSAENDLLRRMEKQAREIYIPIMQPSAVALLQQLIRWINAERILELGTAIGYSAIRMRLAAGSSAKITSIERDPEMICSAQTHIRELGLSDSIKIVEGDATDQLDAVKQNAPYDLILIDAAKAQYEKLFNTYARWLRPGGIIVTDNVFFHGLVCHIDDVRKKQLNRLVHKVDDYNHFLAERTDFDTVFLTVGDGLAISTKKRPKETEES